MALAYIKHAESLQLEPLKFAATQEDMKILHKARLLRARLQKVSVSLMQAETLMTTDDADEKEEA